MRRERGTRLRRQAPVCISASWPVVPTDNQQAPRIPLRNRQNPTGMRAAPLHCETPAAVAVYSTRGILPPASQASLPAPWLLLSPQPNLTCCLPCHPHEEAQLLRRPRPPCCLSPAHSPPTSYSASCDPSGQCLPLPCRLLGSPACLLWPLGIGEPQASTPASCSPPLLPGVSSLMDLNIICVPYTSQVYNLQPRHLSPEL